ncbi:MAG: substrate-binding periplasmic protein, partial [Bdellovibrionales bacterium]
GYYIYPPEITKVAKTGVMGGWAHDIVESMGKELGLKVEWAEEITLDAIYEGVDSGRFDALCSTLWESPQRSKHVLFTQNVGYPTYYPFVRAGDTRFDNDLSLINNPNIKVAVIDGEYGKVVADELYPHATQVALPRGTQYDLIFQEVVTGKADVVFGVPQTGLGFIKANPGIMRMVNKEVVLMPASVMMLQKDELKLKVLIDSTLRHLINRGVVEQIFTKYGLNDGYSTYPAAKPYISPVGK